MLTLGLQGAVKAFKEAGNHGRIVSASGGLWWDIRRPLQGMPTPESPDSTSEFGFARLTSTWRVPSDLPFLQDLAGLLRGIFHHRFIRDDVPQDNILQQ